MEEMNKNVEETMEEKDMEVDIEETLSQEPEQEEPAKEEKKEKASKKKRSARELELALKKSEEQVADLTDKYQRLMAEFENARKRTAK